MERLEPTAQTATISEFDEKQMVLNMGPSHPAMHGTVRIRLWIEGETIVKSDVEIGYLHRAFEKMSENSQYTQVIPYTDRLNYVSPILNNVGYALAVEKLLQIEVPERCQYIRVIMGELSRIGDHLTCIGASAMELGGFTPFLYAIKARDFLWDLVEKVCGARLTTSYTRIGGVSHDLPEGFEAETKAVLEKTREAIREMDKLLQRNRIFYDRMHGVGVISAEEAIDYGFTGPCLRSTGVDYDVRKAHPYLVYDALDFDVPIGEHGDNFDRYLVRLEEMNQSMRIVEQAFAKIPEGPTMVDDPRIVLPPKEETYHTMEGLIYHFKLVTEGIKVPPGEVYSYTEAANGELGFYIVSDGSGKPYKCRVRPPCFAIMQALSRMIDGRLISDVIPTFGSINMIGGEIDR